MSEPYVGEIRIVGFNFAPNGWAFCNGQLMSILDNQTLYSLIGTTYGGDGVNTFGLPNLQSRVPIHQGTGAGLPTYVLGQLGGVENVTLTAQQIPNHTHPIGATTGAATTRSPANAVPALADHQVYNTGLLPVTGSATALSAAGGSQPHDNIVPYLTLNFVISLFGVYPSQN